MTINIKDYPVYKKINDISYRVNPETGEVITFDSHEWVFCDTDETIPDELKNILVRKNIKTEYKNMKTENSIMEKTDTTTPQEIVEAKDETEYTMYEKKDESQIVAEIEGHILKEFVYMSHGKPVLTYAGVKQLAIIQGDIHIGEPIIEKTDDCWIAKASAHNVKNNLKTWGISSQPLLMKLKTGEFVFDEFAMQKAVSKAIRNAIRALMQEQYILKTIDGWMKLK